MPWKHNALRHSFITYRVAQIKNVAQVALEAGNSPEMIFEHYRELVTADAAKEWFSVMPKTKRGKERSSESRGRASSAKGGTGERDSDVEGSDGVSGLV